MVAPPYDTPPPVSQPLSLHEAALAVCTISILLSNSEVPTTDPALNSSTHLQAKVSKGHRPVGSFCGLNGDDQN